MKNNHPKFRALATLLGTTIGAGVFALPYAFSRLGFLTATVLLLIVNFLSTSINQLYVKIIEATHGDHQLPGYALIYLGKWGKVVTFIAITLGLYGALTAYIVQGGAFLSSFGFISQPWASIAFWSLFSVLLFLGLVVASWGATVFAFGIVFLVSGISLFSFLNVSWPAFNLQGVLWPRVGGWREALSLVGIMCFSFGGTAAVPEVDEILRGQERVLSRVVRITATIVTVLYWLFSVSVSSVSGRNTSPAALDGLAESFGGSISVVAPLIGILALGSSFLLLAYALREVFFRDFKLPISLSWLLTLLPPLLIFLVTKLDFISILSLAGSAGIGLSWLLILLIYSRV